MKNLIKKLSRQWGQDIEVNGKQIEVRVTVNVYYHDYFELDMDFESEDEKRDLERKIERGQISPVMIQVESHIDGYMFGLDSLGGCLIELNESEIDSYLNDYAMVQNSLDDCKKNLESFLKKVS